MKYLLDLIVDLFSWIYGRVKGLFMTVLEKFMEINIFEKLIVGASILGFIAVVAPVGKYVIFDAVFTINNPVAHYMIGITLLMLATIYVPGILSLIARVSLNCIYLVYIIYIQSVGGISRAPYELAAGYYFNIIAPVVYMACAIISAVFYRDARG